MRISEMAVGDRIVCSKCANTVLLTERATNNSYQSRISGERAVKTSEYRTKHPDRKRAHQAVQTAKRNGGLVQKPCEVCGSSGSHAHHDDYSKPLDVSWLCHQHHMERHQMLEARKK